MCIFDSKLRLADAPQAYESYPAMGLRIGQSIEEPLKDVTSVDKMRIGRERNCCEGFWAGLYNTIPSKLATEQNLRRTMNMRTYLVEVGLGC
jgi:hypothetical protein